jgi:hypothetical protein
MVHFVDELQEFVGGEQFVNGVEEGVSGRGLPAFTEGH